jgi:hypothetical protein
MDERCSWCDSAALTLRTTFDGPTVHDARQPRIPSLDLCTDCAETLTDYMLARAGGGDDADADADLRTLAAREAEDVLDALAANPGLEAVTPDWLRLRNLADGWVRIRMITGEFVGEDVGRGEAVATLADARRVSVRPASIRVWEEYEGGVADP